MVKVLKFPPVRVSSLMITVADPPFNIAFKRAFSRLGCIGVALLRALRPIELRVKGGKPNKPAPSESEGSWLDLDLDANQDIVSRASRKGSLDRTREKK